MAEPIQWGGSWISVTARMVGRYVWTTTSIDVAIDGKTVLRTGGVPKITGSHTEQIDYGTARHQMTLSWGRSMGRSFPFKITIDDNLIQEGRVPISNWWCAYWPFSLTVIVAAIWLFSR
jgi:hypothetical protein